MTDKSVSEDKRQPSFPLTHASEGKEPIRQLKHERAATYLKIIDAVRVDERRKILAALARQPSGVTYDDLDATLTVSRRTIRHHVSKLVDDGIVTRDGKPAIVGFADQDIEPLAKDAISIVYEAFNQQ